MQKLTEKKMKKDRFIGINVTETTYHAVTRVLEMAPGKWSNLSEFVREAIRNRLTDTLYSSTFQYEASQWRDKALTEMRLRILNSAN